MSPLRDTAQVGEGSLIQKQSLQAVQELWNEWEIHCLILASFGLQIFLFFAAGMRRHSVSRILNSLIWLAYLSADSVAIFVLGHLAVHASSSHPLLIFWAPFLLLHLGGPDTITAFSVQDNELWQRHLLGLVTQASVAGYVISISSWQDNRLLAATVLMLLCGVFKYIGRTLCLYTSRPKFLKYAMVPNLDRYVRGVYYIPGISGRRSFEDILRRRVHDMILNDVDVKLPPASPFSSILLDTPLNDMATVEGAAIIPDLLNVLKSSADRSRAYIYVSRVLVRVYERIYTKDVLQFGWIYDFKTVMSQDSEGRIISLVQLHIVSFLLLFPLISALITLELFMLAEKIQLYSHTDVRVSYILLIGAIILEVASLFMSILSCYASSEAPTSCPPPPSVVLHVANYIHPTGLHRKHWSKMLAQHNMFECYTRQKSTSIMSVVSQWIGETFTRIAISKDLEEFVLGKLLDLGTGEQGGWNFASFRGQLALQSWTTMHTIIDTADLPTSVLIWHIATEICYFGEESNTTSHQVQVMIRVGRELSNYIMYLVFTCSVMLTGSSKLVYVNTHKEINNVLGGNGNLAIKEAIRTMIRRIGERGPPVNQVSFIDHTDVLADYNNQLGTQVQLLKDNIKALDSPVLPRARIVACHLTDMPEDDRWKLIAEVWLEMLFYIAPRCGGAFHAKHLSTGGEFVTHVLQLMRLLGPFLPPPNA
ncbi:hypothetical protein CFC21_106418 [Triticum aestivum]|uniref:DUF4220 domain-containing protein n=2 Tax=Triticum aestivum TaxID=4565 RepID=A0A9R1ME88_WHEAT|nr:uncharacterized protein LOC123166810 [Triticum aestivum]KAF7105635.1 hypothetical protein CFC21_106418 [Triticum aestivum]